MPAFQAYGVAITPEETRGPMGLHKRDHIRSLFQLESVASQWQQAHGRGWTDLDVDAIYETFMPIQIQQAQELSTLIPGVRECFEALKQRGILIGTTTGYPRSVAHPVIDAAAEQGYVPDCTVCADEVPQARPAPWMIYRNMEQLGVFPPSAVLKVGDTIPDIEAGKNAGVRTVAITQTGSEVGLTEAEFTALDPAEAGVRIQKAEAVFQTAGADHILKSVAELPALVDCWS
ncbi:MAG: phosphonoacetaldehyde hydrolase, partial [Planctomycetes bacterium]|nr:phosphonoacetaldehyde hydrolase [Planctomycetota bacterium]